MSQKIAKKDGVEQGLVCIFSVLEPCRSFSMVWKNGKTFIRPAKRRCLFLYYYFLDRDIGLIHVKIQTWFPFRIQIYVNGHEWLAKKLAPRPPLPQARERVSASRRPAPHPGICRPARNASLGSHPVRSASESADG